MTDYPLAFTLPAKMTAEELKKRLGAHVALQLEQPAPLERLYFDTFDWRLFGKGLALMQERGADGVTWWLYRLDGGEGVAEWAAPATTGAPDATAPFFPAALPEGDLAAALRRLVPIRALLPLAHVGGTVSVVRVFNKDIKTVVRVAVEETALLPDGPALPPVARILPVRGYDRRRDEVGDLLAAMPGLEPSPDDPMVLATTAAGHVPGDYSAALDIRLEADQPADEATRHIYGVLLESIQRNEPGVRADIDSEFLHDFRVSIRRTRSALSQIKDVLPADEVEHFRTEFGWLGQMTGPTRDLDVYLLSFNEMRDQLPEHMRDRLEPLRDHLARRQREEQAVLVRALDTTRYRKLVRAWPKFLAPPTPPAARPPEADTPILELANRQIGRAYRRTAREAAAITPETPAEQVHELRKTAKKLRYLIEFYSSLYPAGELKELVVELKQVQDVLGEYQDLQVQIESLERYAAEMQAAGEVPAETLMAIGALTGQLYNRELEVREELTPVLAEFGRRKLRRRFEALVGRGVIEAVEDEAVDEDAAPDGAGSDDAGSDDGERAA
jgi:CHAD domain-containing protein